MSEGVPIKVSDKDVQRTIAELTSVGHHYAANLLRALWNDRVAADQNKFASALRMGRVLQ